MYTIFDNISVFNNHEETEGKHRMTKGMPETKMTVFWDPQSDESSFMAG